MLDIVIEYPIGIFYAIMGSSTIGIATETVRLVYKRHKSDKITSALEKEIDKGKLTIDEAMDAAWKDKNVQWNYNYQRGNLYNQLNLKPVPKAWFK